MSSSSDDNTVPVVKRRGRPAKYSPEEREQKKTVLQ